MKNATKKASADQRTKDAVIKKITDKKDLKYNYPKSCDNLKGRKKFRHQVRAKVVQLNKQIVKIKANPKMKGLQKAKKALVKYESKVLQSA